jgi:ParB/RepB/Spo0J family partition protein
MSNTSNKFLEMLASRKVEGKIGVLTEEITNTRSMKNAVIVPVELLEPNPFQIRQVYKPERLEELAADIKVRGMLEPLVVRQTPDQNYQIIAGERRYRAAKMIGLNEVPVIVKELTDREARLVTLAENIQREDLEGEDERRFFQSLEDQYNLTIKEMAELVNKSVYYVQARFYRETRPAEISQIYSLDQNGELGSNYDNLENANKSSSGTKTRKTDFRDVWNRFSRVLDKLLEDVEENLSIERSDELLEQVNQAERKLAELRFKLSGKLES